MGTGHLYVDKLVKAQRIRSVPGGHLRTKLGKISTEIKNWVIESRNKPKSTDWILELDLNERTNAPKQPFSVVRAFSIQSAKPARGKRGRIEYWHCTAEERNFTFGQLLTKKPVTTTTAAPVDLYELLIGDLQAEIGSLDLESNFSFPVRNLSNEDGSLVLVPQSSPPTGQLVLKLLDGTTTNIALNKR